MFQEEYDVIVVGAGHAGSSRGKLTNLGSKPFWLQSLQNIAQMSLQSCLWEELRGQ
jgi:tRNA uridine 5-carboxymethylaminomethyl modification enzyme